MKYPFEVPFSELEANPDIYISSVFSCLESEFLVMPKGEGFVEYPVFEKGYESLKKATKGFRNIDAAIVTEAAIQNPMIIIIMRTMLGFTPPEWAYVTTQRTGVEVTQGFIRTLDRNIRISPLKPLSVSRLTSERVRALVETACQLFNSPDVVLPAASFAEKDGTFSNTERRVQRVRKAIEPVGGSKADWEIICLIATALGYPMRYGSAAEIMSEIAGVTPSYGGISYERLEKGSLQWPCPTPDHPGTEFLHSGKFSRGLGKFHPVEHISPDEMPDQEYQFVLSTGRRLYHYHTGTMTQRTGTLEVAYPEEYVEINCADAEKLGICDGDKVKVTSRRGQVEVAVRVTDKVTPGMVFTSFHYPAVAINKLTNPARDPIAKIPEYKVCAVKVEKVTGAEIEKAV